jgi:predicted nucleic acid-binding protein
VKYALDTNIFIDGFRNEAAQAEVFAFLNSALPFTYLSAVVMQELAAGARTAQAARDVQRGVFEPFERRQRVFAPSATAFVESGRVLAAIAAREGWHVFDENPSLLNDAHRRVVLRAGHHAHHERRRFHAPISVRQRVSLCSTLARAVAPGME